MLKPKNVKVDGLAFQLHPFPIMQAARLDKKVNGLIAPLLGGLDSFDEGAELDMGKLGSALQEALSSLSDTDFHLLLSEMLELTTFLPKGAAPLELSDSENLDKAFQGKLLSMYKVILEVMKFNHFLPFELASIGGVAGMFTSKSAKSEMENHGSK